MKQVIQNHFGFSRLPFGKDIAPELIFPTASGTEAAAMLELGLHTEDIMLITGPIGCGKSLLIRSTAAGFDATRYQMIYLRGSVSSPSELFKLLLQGMKIDPPYSLSRAKPLFYTAVAEAKRKPLVVVDDAQDCAPEALLALKSMTNFDADSSNRITFILAGQPDLATILAYSHFNALRARIRLTHQLSPMSLKETAGYVDHGLEIVHCTTQLFTEAAKMEIYKRSGGIARSVNTICYQAIVRAAIEQRQTIDSSDLPAQSS
jgi:type II secretory pathway predicted ATPase ExeA